MEQITTCTFFKLEGFLNKWWAFKQMRLGVNKLKNIKGLSFYKILGTGSENGFSATPDFGTYAVFCVWESESDANNFFNENNFFINYHKKSKESFTVFANSAESHGTWDGQQPFVKNSNTDPNKPVLVLTRARIYFWKLLSFWSKVKKVSQSLDQYDGVLFSKGVGEWPLIQQATISIWKTQTEMMNYAYKNKEHKKVVLLTRKLKWYKEEMFARFTPYKTTGVWNGKKINLV